MFKLTNKTGADVDTLGKIFQNDVEVDLLEDSKLRLALEDIIGIRGGTKYEAIAALIRTGEWILSDGDQEFTKEQALHLLKYQQLPEIKVKQVPSGLSGWAATSHNIGDMTQWDNTDPENPESKFVIEPLEGRKLHLTGSKVLISPNFKASNDMYFRVYMDYEVAPGVIQNIMVREDSYTNIKQLKVGAENMFVSPAIAGGADRGSPELVHIKYSYTEAITLDSALNMRLEIGIRDNTPIPEKFDLWIRVEGKSEKV
jgi:hypothetical protein